MTSAYALRLSLLITLFGCGDDAARPASETGLPDGLDADETELSDGDSASELGDAPLDPRCCPIEPPRCDCFQVGGSVADGCHALCDAIPVGWTLVTDENGCAKWVGGEPGSCLPTDIFEPGDSADAAEVIDTADVSDAQDAGDGEVALPDEGPSLRFSLAGSIQLVEAYSDGAGEVVGSWIYADLRDRVAPMTYQAQGEAGDCKIWTRGGDGCEPACATAAVCDIDATCQAQAEPASAGDLTISGLVVSPITGRGGEFGYVFSPEPPSAGLFDAGDAITVSASGAALPAFSATVSGVPDLAIEGIGLIELVDGHDTRLAWTPAGDGSFVELVLQLGWHGAPATAVIACRAPDSAGAIVVSADLIAKFPYFTFGLFQVPSWAERVSRSLVATPAGPIEITASSRVNLGVTHTER